MPAHQGTRRVPAPRPLRLASVVGAGALLLALALAALPPAPLGAQDADLALTLGWTSAAAGPTQALAWGDVDGDGDLDLAVANRCPEPGCPAAQLFQNTATAFELPAPRLAVVWASAEAGRATSVAWGDVDGDGDLDLAVGVSGMANRLYRNEGGSLGAAPAWSSAQAERTTSVAWGDMDDDGDLDLAVGNDGEPARAYRNDGGALAAVPAWSSAVADAATSVAWGDVDGDSDLDLAVGTRGRNRIYRNESGMLTADALWSAQLSEWTQSLAWGDVDGDGDLDLAVGNGSAPGNSRLYRNESTAALVRLEPVWQSVERDQTMSVAWGDMDGDGDLDLAVGNAGQSGAPNRIYRNEGGNLSVSAAWSSPESDVTLDVAWGDVDGDGDLDLAVGNGDPQQAQANRIYLNQVAPLTPSASWSSQTEASTRSVAWGDVDADGDLDLAVGNNPGPSQLYLNSGAALETAAWASAEADRTQSVAWGDADGDGDLDLAVGNSFQPLRLYRNAGGSLSDQPSWSSSEADDVWSVAWGDVDGDGDLDLAAGVRNAPARVYRNQDGVLGASAAWSAAGLDRITSVAWGDMDGDGDLDLAVGAIGQNRLYRNEGGALMPTPLWSSAEPAVTQSVAWGDVDGDGDLDLAVGAVGQNRLYRNDGGALTTVPSWSSVETDYTLGVAWGDADGDGDLDLAVANGLFQPSRLYRNDGGRLTAGAVWSSTEADYTWSVAWGDVDGDGDLDLATGALGPKRIYRNTRDGRSSPAAIPTLRLRRPAPATDADAYSSAQVFDGADVGLPFTLAHPQGLPVRRVIGQFSLDGGGRWRAAVPTPDTVVDGLATTAQGTANRFGWDALSSGMMGQSDNLVVRLIALPDLRPQPLRPHSTPAEFLRGAYASTTYPFRVRGNQVQVLRAGAPVPGALVYRRAVGGDGLAQPLGDLSGQPFRTDGLGYLQGRSELQLGDELLALLPITSTATYTAYLSSAAPTPTGLSMARISSPGVQRLAVADAYPLVLFNLELSLEWDARKDSQLLAQLRYDLLRTSALLYDWTDGQAALGAITIYQDRSRWDEAHIRVYATNSLRPNANQGGIVAEERADPAAVTTRYGPGQVRIGATWNRFGDAGGALGEDWPRALAHELGHFALFLDDNYLGLEAGRLVTVESCPGAMSDPYRDDYSEFHPDAAWLPACARTLSHQNTGRSDWATIAAFYPWLRAPGAGEIAAGPVNEPAAPGGALAQPTQRLFFPLVAAGPQALNPGPSVLPLAVTRLRFIEPAQAPTTLAAPIFYLSANGAAAQTSASARAILFPSGGERLIDLGRPVLGQVTAYGARPGDRLCVYDSEQLRLGCAEPLGGGGAALQLVQRPDWRPEVLVSPVTSRTLALDVGGAPPGLTLSARLYPSHTGLPVTIALAPEGAAYRGLFTLAEPTLDGYVQVWAEGPAPRREVVADYALGGNPGRVRSRDVPRGRNPGRVRSRDAPALSSDGRVILYGQDLAFAEGEFFSLQSATRLPAPPPGRSVVGPGYWLRASAGAPDLRRVSLSIGYLGREVAADEERGVRVYFWDGTRWEPLDTLLDAGRNEASAQARGPGLYALLSSIAIELRPGWNLVAYPGRTARPVADALTSITGAYTTVYGFDATDPRDPWKVSAVDTPAWVDDLSALEPGGGYWINATRAVTLHLQGDARPAMLAGFAGAASSLSAPPATLYGTLRAEGGVAPQPDMRVTARVGDAACGEARTRTVDGQVVFVIDVLAAGAGPLAGCGLPGRPVAIELEGRLLPGEMLWDNSRPRELR